jgi:hypothetical protein
MTQPSHAPVPGVSTAVLDSAIELASGPGIADLQWTSRTNCPRRCDAIVRVTPTHLVLVDELTKGESPYFDLTNFAFGPDDTDYADEIPGNIGFEARQELISLHRDSAEVLWTEPNSAAVQRGPDEGRR